MSLERKLSEIDARCGEILAQRDGEKALSLLASDLYPVTDSLRACINRGNLSLTIRRDIANILGIEPDPI